jgi:hypothetical protein
MLQLSCYILALYLEVLGSNFGSETGYPGRLFHSFLQTLWADARIVP